MPKVGKYESIPIYEPRGVTYFPCWGAIGDFYYHLTMMTPLLRAFSNTKRIVVFSTYAGRYKGQPFFDLCEANGGVDELWLNTTREPGEPELPPTMVEQMERPVPGTCIYMPDVGQRYHHLKGVTPYPYGVIEPMMRATRAKFLVHHEPEEDTRFYHEELEGDFVTLQLGANCGVLVDILVKLDVQVVLLAFPGESFKDWLKDDFTIIEVNGPVEALAIQRLARLHVGIESSQLLGAAIQGVTTAYFPRPGSNVNTFRARLGIGDWCFEIRPDMKADRMRPLIERLMKEGGDADELERRTHPS